MEIKPSQVFRAAVSIVPTIKPSEVKNILNTIDVDSIYNEIRSKYTYKIWDKRSPINGVPASRILGRGDFINADVVYLVYRDGVLMYVQPTNPFEAGHKPISKDEVDSIANKHIDMIAESEAFNIVVEKVIDKYFESLEEEG